MSENSINEVPDQPPLVLLAGESEVHLAAAQTHSLPASTSSGQHSHSSTFVKEGQEERLTWDPLEFEPTETLPSQKINKKDEEHSRLRREKNRGAVARCRLRRKDREERLRKHTVGLENANSGLRAEIARLQHELKGLSTHVMCHMELCHRGEEHRGTHWTTDQLAWRTPTWDSGQRWRGYSMNTMSTHVMSHMEICHHGEGLVSKQTCQLDIKKEKNLPQ